MFNETVAQDGLHVSAEMLEAANIREGEQVSITVSSGTVTIQAAAQSEADTRFRASMEKIFDKRSKVFEALAEGAP